MVSPAKLSTVDNRALAVAAPHIWNTLPTDVVAASSLSTFRQLLKRFLFKQSYLDIIYWHSGPCSGCATYATVKIYWLVGWLIDWLIFLGDRCPEGGNIRPCAHPRVAVPSHRATRLSWWSSQARLGSPGLAWRNKSVWDRFGDRNLKCDDLHRGIGPDKMVKRWGTPGFISWGPIFTTS